MWRKLPTKFARLRGLALSAGLLGATLGFSQVALAEPEAPATEQPAAEAPAEGAEGQGEADHEGHGEGGHHAAPGHINWIYGFIGTKDEGEPDLLYRTKDMPAPFGAMILNTGLVFFLLYHFGRKPLAAALTKRKVDLLRGIEEASGMREEAAAQLSTYEVKLGHIQEEIERVRRESQAHGASERERILREAREKRERIEQEARTMVALELKAHSEALKTETIQLAMAKARELLSSQLAATDQQRMVDEYLVSLDSAQVGGGS